ncbi:MAG: hypothetical protein JJLCMIEE_03501 [Acidimicrobiales bacterium]|nr:MAG: glycosyltransferase [Actinomycetota bacterium]MBV6510361.1 hypothetical protein [Acidimicrobiales bacterium]
MSFRLGLTDGVSIVADHWMAAFEEMGFDCYTVAGDGPVDRLIPELAITSPEPPRPEEVADALSTADLVVVENLCTIPLNPGAARVVAAELRGRPALLHHHDPPWQRARFAAVTELPPDDPAWRHVTINRFTAVEMRARGLNAAVVHNGFEVESDGDRDGLRQRLRVDRDELLVAHPVRAIPRKNIPAAIRFCETLGATYWLLGAAEEGYGPDLDQLLLSAGCRVVHQPWRGTADIYAAADAVVFPSTWEGFGNPPIEASIHRTPVAVGHYRVAEELRGLGFEWFEPEDPASMSRFLDHPDGALLDRNRALAVEHFSVAAMKARLHEVLSEAGWCS